MTDDEAAVACAVLASPAGGHAALACLLGCDDANPAPATLWQAFLHNAPVPSVEVPCGLRLTRVLSRWDALRRSCHTVGGGTHLARIRDLGARVIALDDAAYPPRLRTIPHRPALLFVRGPAALDAVAAIAIVGTRRSTSYGRHVTARLAGDLAAAGVTIISGMARGIDAAAHRAALEAGGPTVAVLGTGLDVCFPTENRPLWRTLGETGALVTEYLPGTEGLPHHFPARNRIVSGLARAVVVVEAAHKSGALITARLALEQNRDVCAVPGDVTAPGSAGPHDLLRHGAALVETAADIAQACGLPWGEARPTPAVLPAGAIPPELAAHLSMRPRSVDDLARVTALPAFALIAILERLALLGAIERDAAGRYAVASAAQSRG